MGFLLAVVVGVLHAALAPVVVVAGVKPNFVLVGVVLAAATSALPVAAAFAFIAGLTANLIVPEPLGSMPLTMLLIVPPIVLLRRWFGASRWILPIAAAFAGSVLAELVALLILSLVTDAAQTTVPLRVIALAAVLNAAITAALLVPLRLWVLRDAADPPATW